MSNAIAGLPARLRFARSLAGVSARRLDSIAGLQPGHTNAIESGRRPNIESVTAEKLSTALGISLDWLILGNGREPTAKAIRAAIERARGEAA